MNYLALSGLVIFLSVLFITLWILIRRPNMFVIWALASFWIGLWGWGIFKAFTTNDYNIALFWSRFLNTVAILIPPFLFHFCCSFSNKIEEKKKELIIYYLIGILYFLMAIVFYKSFVNDAKPIHSFKFYPTAGSIYYFFPLYYTYLLTYGVVLLGKELSATTSVAKKNRLRYFLYGIAFSVGGGVTTFFPIVSYKIAFFGKIPPVGVTLTPLYAYLVAYAILQNKILDINLAWRYITEYLIYLFLTIAILSGYYFLLIQSKITGIFLICVSFIPVGVMIPFLREIIKNIMRNLLLRKYRKIWNKLAKIAEDKTLRYEIKDIVSVIIKDVPQVLAVNNAVYYRLRDNGEKFESFYLNKEDEKFLSKENILTERFKTVKSLIYKEHLTDSKEDIELKIFLREHYIELCSPVFFNMDLVGIIAYGEKKDGTIFHKEEIESIQEIVKNVQEQIVNILYLKYMSTNYAEQVLTRYKDNDQMELLNAIKHLGSFRNIPELSKQIIGLTNRYLNANSSTVYIYNEEKQGFIIVDTSEEKNKEDLPNLIKENHYLMKYLKQRKEIVFCNELCKWAEESQAQDWKSSAELSTKLKATLIVPLIDITLLGFIVIGERRKKDEVYSSNDLMMLSFIADRAEITISNIIVREQAERDDLTGIHNRGYLTSRTKAEVANSLKNGKPISYILADVDDFKWFNDNKGYDAGNEVLKAIVKAIEADIRSIDEFCRWGGEEFVLLGIGGGAKESSIIANKILNAVINNTKIKELEKFYGHKITISIGVACFTPSESVYEFTNEDVSRISTSLFVRSNKALKKAKRNGKNQVSESQAFGLGEEYTDKDLFPLKTLIISKNTKYNNMYLDGVDIDIKDNLDECLRVCNKYDVCIIDMDKENNEIPNTIKAFKTQSRDLVIGIISSNLEHRKIAEDIGIEFMLSPMRSQDLEKWTEYLKNRQ